MKINILKKIGKILNWEDIKFTYEKQIEDNAEAAKEQREKMKNK